ncbi:uncharacterized protein LOC122020384 [Zingiber officinale]|uniref:uncharacterized protein LOC122020384 n=1 Tax=Zingiber officinale TaxID=94328 RepID=UPI001C4B2F55|nr:uncharacterized protein LOC122020384 [Zingiber officinale]
MTRASEAAAGLGRATSCGLGRATEARAKDAGLGRETSCGLGRDGGLGEGLVSTFLSPWDPIQHPQCQFSYISMELRKRKDRKQKESHLKRKIRGYHKFHKLGARD